MLKTQPWIRSARSDLLFILAPGILASLIAIVFRAKLESLEELPPWTWLLLVLGVDVAHVYATLFRTYLDPSRRTAQGKLLWLAPALAWGAGVALYAQGALTFWRCLAYLAVFHFVRQQYGFLRIYSRQQKQQGSLSRAVDTCAIYAATLFPLLHWHLASHRRFNWFVEGDFFELAGKLGPLAPLIDEWALAFYSLILAAFLVKEARAAFQGRPNLPKAILVFGTALSWLTGIVLLNGDLTFTMTNVLAHGIPYLALVWFMRTPEERKQASSYVNGRANWLVPLLFFLGTVLLLAFLEEGLWDALVWKDHPQYFGWLYGMPSLEGSPLLTWVVPLLALPQATHYILDGFIWKLRRPAQLSAFSMEWK